MGKPDATFDPCAYTVCISRRKVDGESLFVATIRELPDVAEYDECPTKAYALAIDTIETLHMAAQGEGWAFPPPDPFPPSLTDESECYAEPPWDEYYD
jgi:hypothetical protein